MFVTLEDESTNANLIVWPSVFEQKRRPILSASMMGCRGRGQCANGVIHLIVEHVVDLSGDLKLISGIDTRISGYVRSGRRGQARWELG